jgi:hypothetical protein
MPVQSRFLFKLLKIFRYRHVIPTGFFWRRERVFYRYVIPNVTNLRNAVNLKYKGCNKKHSVRNASLGRNAGNNNLHSVRNASEAIKILRYT